MEQQDMNLRIVTGNKTDITCKEYTIHKDGRTGHVYVPVTEFPDAQEKVLSENWNLKDIKLQEHKPFETCVQVNFDVDKRILKAIYSNGKYKWISMREWQDDQWQENPEYKDSWISEVNIKPYYYTDDYGQDKIAGQLKYMELNINKPLYGYIYNQPVADPYMPNKHVSASSHKEHDIYEELLAEPTKEEKLVTIIHKLGFSPKEAIKILLEEV